VAASAENLKILGVLNVTPDSFSDGGSYADPEKAHHHFRKLLSEGADFIDIGAESTRPGAKPISCDEEWRRLGPVLELVSDDKRLDKVTLDTRNFNTMLKAVKMGVAAINNVGSIPQESELLKLFHSNKDLVFIVCHMHGTPETMQDHPLNETAAITGVRTYFESTAKELIRAGCRPENIYFDPGVGFGKSDPANISILLDAARLSKEFKLAIGVSRKGFILRVLGELPPKECDCASKLIEGLLWLSGVSLVRTHDVKNLRSLINLMAQATPGWLA
jgi:dihydropteroate synthase